MDRVNSTRKNCQYSDAEAAIEKKGTTFKAALQKSPFVCELEYGINNKGYWTYENMVLQLEDCINVLKITHPEFDFVYLFDHSNGHNRMRPNGLNINKINVRFAGKQPKMRSSKVETEIFGPFHTANYALQPGMIQHMQFSEVDDGPCYLLPVERMQKKNDKCVGTKVRSLNKSKFIDNMKADGISNPVGNKKQLQQMCTQRNLPLTVTENKIIEGWHMKPKGAFQILFERGWLDPINIHHYTAEGRKDADSNPIQATDPTGCNWSINELMTRQSDFINELTLLQYHGQKLGVVVDRSPKCHPEIAGEGIEYLWGLSKFWYRRTPIHTKRSKDNF